MWMGRLRPEKWLARLTGPDTRKRKHAVARVCELALGDSDLLAVLQDALRSPDDHAVFWIVTELNSLGPRARVAVPALVRCLAERREFGVRQAAVHALAAIAPDDPSVKVAVFRTFADASPFVRREALQAAIKVVGLADADLDVIRGMEADPDEAVARWSEVALRNIRLQRGEKHA
jgi:hypothetical protein